MESSFIHADIFFYITTIAVVVLTALLIILFYHLVRIARHLERAAMKLREESERIIEDVSFVRESIEDQGGRALSFLKFIFGSFMNKGNSNKSSRDKAGKRSKVKTKKRDNSSDSE